MFIFIPGAQGAALMAMMWALLDFLVFPSIMPGIDWWWQLNGFFQLMLAF